MFEMTAEWWEPIVRVTIIYVFLLVLLRLSGKREVGQLGPMELLTILLISETVSPALTAEDSSVSAAMLASGTLIVLTFLIALVTYLSRALERVIEGAPRALVEAGELKPATLRAERITDAELHASLRKQGLRSLDQVEEATVESDGQITFIKKEK
jgi:uncharacterized membrane protein YcaP (DUF421 family)